MKTLLTVSYVVDVDDYEELSELVEVMESAATKAMASTLAKADSSLAEMSAVFQFFGVAASPMRETIEKPPL